MHPRVESHGPSSFHHHSPLPQLPQHDCQLDAQSPLTAPPAPLQGCQLNTLPSLTAPPAAPHLQDCQLDALAASHLAAAPSLPLLLRLSLGSNPLGPSAGAALAALLACACGLRDLGLRGVGLGDAGVEALAPAVQQHSRLRKLDLADNSLGLTAG